MKCSECIKEGKKSHIYPGMSMITAMYCAPFYDDEGVYHHHDSNLITEEFTCSNGHSWITEKQPECPNCDWGKNNGRILHSLWI